MLLANPYVLLAAVLALGGAAAGSYIKGRSDGRAIEIAKQATQDELVRTVAKAATAAAAEAISAIEVKHVTYRQQLDREIVHVPDYSRCVHSAVGLSAINAALTGADPHPTGDRELSTTDATDF